MNSTIVHIPTESLRAHPDNAKLFHDIDGEEWQFFKENIHQNGILHPLLVMGGEDVGYTVLSGHQRLRAAKALEWETVPCILLVDADHRNIIVSTNLGRRLTTMERYRIAMHMLDQIEDGRKDRERDENGHFIHSAQNGQNGPARNQNPPRDHIAAMVPGVTKHDIEIFRKIRELPGPVQQELFRFVEKENPNKRELKEKVNELNAEKRKLRAELREEKKMKLSRREMEQMREYNAAQHNPAEHRDAKTFDAVNQSINDACTHLHTLVAKIFSHGKIGPDAARALEPGIKALLIIMEEQITQLRTGWRNMSRDLDDIGTNQEESE